MLRSRLKNCLQYNTDHSTSSYCFMKAYGSPHQPTANHSLLCHTNITAIRQLPLVLVVRHMADMQQPTHACLLYTHRTASLSCATISHIIHILQASIYSLAYCDTQHHPFNAPPRHTTLSDICLPLHWSAAAGSAQVPTRHNSSKSAYRTAALTS